MELEQLPRCLDLYSNSGYTINQEKCNLLMNSLILLQNENHFKKVFFWGQIYGIQNDYNIAFGYEKDALKDRVFYYSRNAINWTLVPKIKEMDKRNFLTYISTNRFIGIPSVMADVVDDEPTDELPKKTLPEDPLEGMLEQNEMSPEETVMNAYKLKEEDRLAAAIRFINQEAAVVPRGALFKQTSGRVVPNPAFHGLRLDEANIISNYMHYRIPREKWQVNVARRPDYNYATDFLDTIAEDIPKDRAWSIQICQGHRAVVLHSLYWPGLTFYHLLNTKIHGFMYMGFGQRNLDLPFMVEEDQHKTQGEKKQKNIHFKQCAEQAE